MQGLPVGLGRAFGPFRCWHATASHSQQNQKKEKSRINNRMFVFTLYYIKKKSKSKKYKKGVDILKDL
jgi:hypothetical protein